LNLKAHQQTSVNFYPPKKMFRGIPLVIGYAVVTFTALLPATTASEWERCVPLAYQCGQGVPCCGELVCKGNANFAICEEFTTPVRGVEELELGMGNHLRGQSK
jgi:hypothetical protein